MSATRDDDDEVPDIHRLLRSLPLIEDDLYLGMQALTLATVDQLIRQLEDELHGAYVLTDKVDTGQFILVSGISQMWVFALYELLRTWRQRTNDVLRFVSSLASVLAAERDAHVALKRKEILASGSDAEEIDAWHWPAYERAAADGSYAAELAMALDRSELAYRRLEALRMNLAKHEVPRRTGTFGTAPGYGRMGTDGSIRWQVDLGDKEVDAITRRQIASSLSDLDTDAPLVFLPELARKAAAKLPKTGYYRLKFVRLVLDNGDQHPAVIVLDRQIVEADGLPNLPFDIRRVVDCIQDESRLIDHSAPRAMETPKDEPASRLRAPASRRRVRSRPTKGRPRTRK